MGQGAYRPVHTQHPCRHALGRRPDTLQHQHRKAARGSRSAPHEAADACELSAGQAHFHDLGQAGHGTHVIKKHLRSSYDKGRAYRRLENSFWACQQHDERILFWISHYFFGWSVSVCFLASEFIKFLSCVKRTWCLHEGIFKSDFCKPYVF